MQFLFFITFILTLFFACNDNGDIDGNSGNQTLPEFTDLIPYHLLEQGTLVFKRIGPPGNPYSGFYVIDADQKKSWRIDCGNASAPSVSPDGKLITYSFCVINTTWWDIFIMNIDGTSRRNITGMTGDESTPSWSTDGKQLFFSLDRFYSNTNNTEALYRQSPVENPSDRIQLIDYNKIDPPNFILGEGLISSSSNGKLLVLQMGLRTFDADGSNMKLIIPVDNNSDHLMCSPQWSPDGNKIALLSFKRNSDLAVMLYDADGKNQVKLATVTVTGTMDWLGQDNQLSLCWSPDGSKIAFTRPDGVEVGSHIYIINKDGTGLAQITSAPGVTDFSLSWNR